jgi:glycosyltransferase involved in cell wall biosynthesis
MLKLLILQETVSNYNIPIYTLLSKNYDLTIGYIKNNEFEYNSFVKFKKFKYFKLFNIYIINQNIFSYCNNFDIVIFPSDMHHILFCCLPFNPLRKYKVISWTPGIRASYKVRFDLNRAKSINDYLYGFILKKCDALIFYMNEPKEFWKHLIDSKKIFVAHNTIDVNKNLLNFEIVKNTILFVGTLYKEKKIFELINAFVDTIIINESFKNYKLEIIGFGPEFHKIKKNIKDNNLSENIILRGKITDEVELAHAFNRALICVSPDQAGLSVLLSMGYGVPFVTRHNSITGGERLNIVNDFNGILYNNENDLKTIILDCFTNSDKYLIIGQNAYNFYLNNATIQHMYKGFINAINFVMKPKL